jgi:hypothetical protein
VPGYILRVPSRLPAPRAAEERLVPISSEDRELYPVDWTVISEWVRFVRAGGRSECTGECGGPTPHLDRDQRCRNRHGEPRWGGAPTQCTVILGTAHLDHNPTHSDPDKLLALCESCHLRLDQAHHRATRERNRLHALGMQPLFELTEVLDP